MQISPKVRYVVSMLFITVVLGASLYRAGMDVLVGVGVRASVVFGFGTYLYFRMLRSGRRDPENPGE